MPVNEAEEIDEICRNLRKKLERAVQALSYEGTTLSGGLDTSIINYVASRRGEDLRCISVGFEESRMEDVKYARTVADELGLKNHVRTFDFDEVKKAARGVVRVTRSFDPMEIRNGIPIYIAIEEAKDLGMKSILTGDGSDELFAGYSFLYNLPIEKLQEELEKTWTVMRFSSQPVAESLGMRAGLPYLQEEFKEFAMNIKPELKVGKRDGERFGKWILRKAYEGKLPDAIIWRKKAPIEVGAGTTILQEKFKFDVNEGRFKSKRREVEDEDGVFVRSEEQLFYYEIYRSIFGPPEPNDPEGRTCPYCGANVSEDSSFCRTCGSSV